MHAGTMDNRGWKSVHEDIDKCRVAAICGVCGSDAYGRNRLPGRVLHSPSPRA